jgi:hypothetical protein
LDPGWIIVGSREARSEGSDVQGGVEERGASEPCNAGWKREWSGRASTVVKAGRRPK